MYIFSDEVRQAYEQLPIPFVIDQLIDGKVIPLLISDGFCKLVEMDRDKAAEWFVDGQFERIHPDDVGKVAHVSEEFINHRSGYNVIFRSRHKDGYHYIHAVGGWMTMPDGTELAALTYTDVSGSRDAISAATKEYGLFQQDLFFTDPVTGLPNVNYLHKYSNEKVHSMRVQGLKPALIYSDINFMQSYNNQYGFAKGDDLLRLVASVFMDVFPDALVTRGAEDHFIVITPMSDRKQLGASIDEANRKIKTEAYGNTTGIHAGICEYEDDMPTADALDLARRAFKRMGTNLNTAWRFFSREDDNLYWSRRYIIENFNKALENGWFKVYYQGIASVESRKEVALEALARWVDPIRGIISPKEFIPALEESMLTTYLLILLDLVVLNDSMSLKQRVWAENSVLQEFWIAMLLTNLVNVIRRETDGIIKCKTGEYDSNRSLKHHYKTNKNETVGALNRYLPDLIDAETSSERMHIIKHIFRFIIQNKVINKKGIGESNPRNIPRNVKNHMNVKTTH